MNKKETLASLNGGAIEDYTHVLETAYQVIQRIDYYDYCLSPQRGSLTPQTIDNSNTIFLVGFDSGINALFVDVVGLKVDAVYFGAKSKNKVDRLPFWGSNSKYNIYQLDSGKADNDLIQVVIDAYTTPQEVWISTTPPPLGIKRKIATISKRWHNEQEGIDSCRLGKRRISRRSPHLLSNPRQIFPFHLSIEHGVYSLLCSRLLLW